jgi:hypothetical protein
MCVFILEVRCLPFDLSPLRLLSLTPHSMTSVSVAGLDPTDLDAVNAVETIYELLFDNGARCDEFVVNILDALPAMST